MKTPTVVTQVTEGIECYTCEKVVPKPPPFSKSNGYPEGFHIVLTRITDALNVSTGEAYFCTKDCLLEGIRWHASHIYNASTL